MRAQKITQNTGITELNAVTTLLQLINGISLKAVPNVEAKNVDGALGRVFSKGTLTSSMLLNIDLRLDSQ